jgi:voltage-gated potassium channel Kch
VPVETVGWRERLRYGFDNWMSRGTGAIMALLGLATVVFVFAVALAVVLLRAFPQGAEKGNLWDIAWGNLMRTLDPGTMGADSGWGFRLLMLVVTVGGLVFVASLIGIVSGAFDDKMVELRRGRSRVIETDHTVIVGWNNQLFTIIAELCMANASRKRSTIVVLADRDKVEMEDEIRTKVPGTGSTAIICRRGNPRSQLDLDLASPQSARSIVVLPDDDDDRPDVNVIKTVLALAGPVRAGEGPTVIAELRDPTNLEAARLAGQGRARWVLAGELINRMTVQTCLQRGLSAVCTELLDFAGDEIYFTELPQLVGETYLDAQVSFADSTVIGLARGNKILLNPPANDFVEEGDQLILIAQDDSTIAITAPETGEEQLISNPKGRPAEPDRTLILGYNSNLQGMLNDLADHVPPGSSVCVVADVEDPDVTAPVGLTVEVTRADTTSRRVLDDLGVDQYDHILVLAYRGLLDAQVADAKTLVTLLHLRDIADRADLHLNIVSEMLDDRNRELAEVTKPDDFIVSDRLASLMLAQVCTNPQLLDLFEQLFSSGGSEVYVRPAELYVTAEAETDFYTVAVAAARRQETAIGFRLGADAHSRTKNYGVHLNPTKSQRRRFALGDSIIVLAETA